MTTNRKGAGVPPPAPIQKPPAIAQGSPRNDSRGPSGPPVSPATPIDPGSPQIPDYVRHRVDIFCGCKGKGSRQHNFNVRCDACAYCGRQVKGEWFNEHEMECWERQRK